ncbi:VOC family protein [Bordetella genomosp. 13]|uniref:VOC family protein n=1 Tax=Bordetella genomosp. 13 TaxID=463040 RepID=UPI0011A3361D|nr:VOC family protein [Bordetella genomosp. 13]
MDISSTLPQTRTAFHFAFNVRDLDESRRFYGQVMGCREGRSTDTWVDFDFFGHQISLHLGEPFPTARTGKVGKHLVPMPHFGLAMLLPQWQALAERLREHEVEFMLEPQVRFEGEPGEQWTMFFLDPFGNPIEVKGFRTFEAMYEI